MRKISEEGMSEKGSEEKKRIEEVLAKVMKNTINVDHNMFTYSLNCAYLTINFAHKLFIKC
jgi:hypothetical protein